MRSLRNEVRRALGSFERIPGRAAVALPREHRERHERRGELGSALCSRAYRSGVHDWLRVVEITTTASTYIVNVAAFPAADRAMPLVQAELVVVRGRPVLLLLDVQALSETDAARGGATGDGVLAEVRAAHPRLVQAVERPAWSEGLIGADAVWCNELEAGDLAEVAGAFASFLAWAGRAERLVAGLDRDAHAAGERAATLARVRHGFLAHGPSPFLASMFGRDFATAFHDRMLFPPLPASGAGTLASHVGV